MEATPRPWTLFRGTYIVGGDDDCIGATDGLDKGDTEAKANAAFIVKAANAHDRLVEALELAETWFMTEGTCPPDDTACDQCKLERQIRAALALARGEVE